MNQDPNSLMGIHIIVTGNFIDGLKFIGPFKTGEHAIIHRDEQLTGDCWIAKLEAPKEI